MRAFITYSANRRRPWQLASVFVALVLLGLTLGVAISAVPADAQTDSDLETELVDRFAPVLAMRARQELCDTSGEQYAPMSVETVLDNPDMLLRQVGVGNPVANVGPTGADIFDKGRGFYIDFPGDAFEPGCIYEKDYLRYSDGNQPVVYAHIATQENEPDKLAVQYWFFWYYNKYNNLHEGDWEGIQLMFDVGSVSEALETNPSSIGLSQHFGGEVANWGNEPDTKLELADSHPVIYPAVGSHASYFEPALYLGRSSSQGLGCDDTQDVNNRIEPDVVLLPDEVTDSNDQFAWLMFEGLWGEQRFGAFSGATGPITKPRWAEPVDWHNTLRNSSVVVPEGNETSVPYVTGFCSVVGFGSGQYLAAQQHPVQTTLLIGALALVLTFVAGRTQWKSVPAIPVIKRRRLGQMLTASARFYWKHRKLFVGISLGYIVLETLSVLATLLLGVLLSPLGLLGAGVTGFAALLAQAVSTIVASAATNNATNAIEHESPATASGSYRAAVKRLPGLVSTLLRALLVVGGLAITIVGIPWAIRQYVRYQLAIPAIMLEGETDAQAALRQSSELVYGRRRWLHTATVVLLVQGLAVSVSAVFGLLLLMATSGLPLWLYSAVTAASSAFVLPFSALAIIMLYGNAKAEALASTNR